MTDWAGKGIADAFWEQGRTRHIDETAFQPVTVWTPRHDLTRIEWPDGTAIILAGIPEGPVLAACAWTIGLQADLCRDLETLVWRGIHRDLIDAATAEAGRRPEAGHFPWNPWTAGPGSPYLRRESDG